MRYSIESDFAKHVKSNELHRVYLLYGSQDYLITLYAKLLTKNAIGDAFQSFNLHHFDDDNLNLQAFYDAVESAPFLSDRRCVTLSLDPDKLDSSAMTELCNVLSDPPPTTTIIISLKNPAPKKLTPLLKACDAAGCVVELGSRRNSDTLRFLRDRAQKNNCELDSDTAHYLIERCTDDLQRLSTELDKLCASIGSGKITRTEIDTVVTPVLQARIYDLSKAILRGNYDQAIDLVDQLIRLREPVSKVLAVLSGAFTELYRGYAARQAAIPAERAAIELGYPKNRTFALKNAMSDCGAYSAAQLGRMLSLLADADLRLKSTGGDDRVELEETITKLFLQTGKR